MADVTKIGIEVEASTANNQNIKSLKAQLREAIQEAQILGQQDLGSASAIAAQKRVAELRDKIDDTNDAIQSFTGKGQFEAFGKVVQGVAGGFAAAQGAMALFGNESEDLQKVLLKVNAAMALTQGLAALEDAPRAFMQIRTMIVSQVIPALGTLRGALIATGIGAAAVAVGLLVANWEKVVKVVRDFIGLGPTQQEILEQQTKELEKQNELIENRGKTQELYIRALTGRNKEIAEANKKHTDELLAIQQEYQDAQLKIQKNEALSTDEKYNKLVQLEKDFKTNQSALVDAQQTEQREQIKKFAEIDNQAAKEKKAREDAKLKAQKESNDAYAKLADERFTKDMYAQIKAQKIVDEEAEKLKRKEFEDAQKSYDMQQKSLQDDKDATAIRIALKQKELENQQAVTDEIGSIISGAAQLAGANAETQKKIASAMTLIDTYFAAQKAYSSQMALATPDAPVRATIAAASAIIAGLVRVKAINSVNAKGGGGVGGSAATPPPPQFTPASSTQVQGAGNVTLSNQPQQNNRVYVVESDIRNTMNKIDVIEKGRTIG